MLNRRATLAALLASLAASNALAQPEGRSAPPGDAAQSDSSRSKALFVIDRHIRAVGGEETIRATRHVSFTGTFEIQGAAFVGQVRSSRAAPGLLFTQLELGPIGTILQGYNGEHAWSVHPSNGPTLLEGTAAAAMMLNANPQNDLHYEDNYVTIEYLGDDTFEGEPAFAVRLVDHLGTETTEYFSKGDGERIGVSGTRPSANGPIPYTRALKDYKRFDNHRMPTRTIERFGGQVITVSIKDVSFDVIDEDRFTPPAEVLELIEAADPENAGDGSP